MKYVLLCLSIFFFACKGTDLDSERHIVASAFGEELLWSDLRKVIPLSSSTEDSLAMANNFVNNWLREQTVLASAKGTLKDDDVDLEEKINNYRNSLLVYNFEKKWVEQKLDTALAQGAVQAYYGEHKEKFRLKEDVVKLRWFVLPKSIGTDTERKLVKLFRSEDPDKQSELEQILANEGGNLKDYDGAWTRWKKVMKELPLADPDLKRSESRSTWSIEQDEVVYFVQLKSQRASAGEAPIELVQDEIAAILLNQKKAQLLEKMRKDLFKEAQDKGNVRIHE